MTVRDPCPLYNSGSRGFPPATTKPPSTYPVPNDSVATRSIPRVANTAPLPALGEVNATEHSATARNAAPRRDIERNPKRLRDRTLLSIIWGPIQSPLRPGCDGWRRAARGGVGVEVVSIFILISYGLSIDGQDATH